MDKVQFTPEQVGHKCGLVVVYLPSVNHFVKVAQYPLTHLLHLVLGSTKYGAADDGRALAGGGEERMM